MYHQGCYIRFEEDGPLITIYNSGKYIIRASSIDEVHAQDRILLNHLGELEIPEEVKQLSFDINNIVAVSELDREIALDPLSKDLTKGEVTFSESSGRLSYKLYDSNCTINMFRTGKLVLMGAPSPKELEEAWRIITEELSGLFVSSE